jgi:hypothetical protein
MSKHHSLPVCRWNAHCTRPNCKYSHPDRVTIRDICKEIEHEKPKAEAYHNRFKTADSICGGHTDTKGICNKPHCPRTHLYGAFIGEDLVFKKGKREEGNDSVREYGRVCTWHLTKGGCTDENCAHIHLKQDSTKEVWSIVKRQPLGFHLKPI